ncbi:PEP-utilizing enzyme [Streptomyces albus]
MTEGVVRVVHDAAFTEVEPGDILVCATTDPSWASVLFLSGALVVDVGGPLSHAAVVAREIGVPCVVGTGDGTRALATGDRVRVDGGAGTVEVLDRAAVLTAQEPKGGSAS